MASTSGKTPEERLDAVAIRTSALSDAMIVQGFLEGRIERNLAELTDGVRDLAGSTRNLTDTVQALTDNHSHTQAALRTLIGSQSGTRATVQALQAALQGLIEQIDRFLRGQQGNGHRRSGDE